MKILLIEDHIVVRAGLKMLLQSGDWNDVVEAGDSASALAALKSQTFGLILLDLMLGDEKGLELATQIRHLYPDLPILVLTMHSDQPLVRAALRAGVNGYLLKQASREELLAAIQSVSCGGLFLDARVAPPILADLRRQNESSNHIASYRRQAILNGVKRGLTNQQLAEELSVSASTVKNHLRELFHEYGVKDRHALQNMDRSH